MAFLLFQSIERKTLPNFLQPQEQKEQTGGKTEAMQNLQFQLKFPMFTQKAEQLYESSFESSKPLFNKNDILEVYSHSLLEQFTSPQGRNIILGELDKRISDLYGSMGLQALKLTSAQDDEIRKRLSTPIKLLFYVPQEDWADFQLRFMKEGPFGIITGTPQTEENMKEQQGGTDKGPWRTNSGALQEGYIIKLKWNMASNFFDHEALHIMSGLIWPAPITEANKKKMESYKRLEEAMNSLIGGDGEYARWTEPLLAMLKKMKPADQKDMLDKLVRTWLNMPIDEKEGQEAVDFVAKATGWEEKK